MIKKIFILFWAVATLSLFASPKIKVTKNSVLISNGKISSYMTKGKNYNFTLSGKNKDNKNLGLVLRSIIWYHGRTGNTKHFYQDQDELKWTPKDVEVKGNLVRLHSGNVDIDVVREIEVYNDIDALRLEYIVTSKESRNFSLMRFPLTNLTKDIESVSFDDGFLKSYQTKAMPSKKDLAKARVLLLHMPKHGKTLMLMLDVNSPLKYGHKLGNMMTFSKAAWCKTVNFHHLWQSSLDFWPKGMKANICMYYQLLDGSLLDNKQKEAVKKLADRFKLTSHKYSKNTLAKEYMEPSVLAGRLKSIPGVELWQESTMKRIYPNMQVPKKSLPVVSVTCAGNERESFQIAIKAKATTKLTKIAISDLSSANNKKISKNNIKINALEYQLVESPLSYVAEEHNFADKMLPLPEKLPITLMANKNTVLHVTVYAPANTPKGIYKGTISLTVNGKAINIPLAVRVWGFSLPKESAFTTLGLLWTSPQKDRNEVLKYLSECGISGTVYHGGQAQLRKYFNGKDLNLPDNFNLATKAVKEYNLQIFTAPWCFLGAWDWNPGKKVHFLSMDANSKEFEEKFTNYFKSLYRQVKAKGILDKTYAYMWDEMTGGHYETMRKTVNIVRKNAPGVKILTVAAPDPEVLANNDVICAGPYSHWWSKDAYNVVQNALKNNKKIWIYMNSVTFSNYTEAIVPRLTPWMCYPKGLSGFLQWTMDFNWAKGTFANTGHVWMLYPTKSKPIYSVRLEYFRDGVEDFNMMTLTKKLDKNTKDLLDKEIQSVAPIFGKTSMDIEKLDKVRKLIGDTLEKKLK